MVTSREILDMARLEARAKIEIRPDTSGLEIAGFQAGVQRHYADLVPLTSGVDEGNNGQLLYDNIVVLLGEPKSFVASNPQNFWNRGQNQIITEMALLLLRINADATLAPAGSRGDLSQP